MSTITLWAELQRIAEKTVRRFALKPFKGLRAITHPKARMFGCASRDGWVEMRLHCLGHPTRPLSRRTLFDTLAHELAHIRFPTHRQEWKELKQAILNYWQDQEERIK